MTNHNTSTQPRPPDNPASYSGPVIVQTEHFRCMAYLGEDGKWRSYYGGKELIGEVVVVPKI